MQEERIRLNGYFIGLRKIVDVKIFKADLSARPGLHILTQHCCQLTETQKKLPIK